MITLDNILQAQSRLQGIAARTPLVRYYGPLTTAQEPADQPRQIFFKPESLQPIGSFKLRGAYNKVASLADAERARGVISYSSGNHAQGVAYAARAMAAKCVIVMPNNAPEIKVESTRALGAEVVFVGPASSERLAKAEALASEHGYAIIPPYDDLHIIAGQGTAGLEILADLPDVDLVLVPVGGGGLISGVSAAIKLSGSKAKVVGVEPAFADDAQQSFRSGSIVHLTADQVTRTLADGLRTQSIGKNNFEHIRAFVDDIITVSEEEIRASVRLLATNARLVAEPSGAVTFAALSFHLPDLPPFRKAVAIISGGNLEPKLLAEILSEA